MNIVKPTQSEKDQAIKAILSLGLTKPKSLWEYLHEIYSALGFRNIFLNTAQSLIMTLASTIGFLILYPLSSVQHIYATLLAVAPIFFIFILVFTETIERLNGLYELRMTCKYTVQQITVFRVLCFSLLGAVFCAFITLYFNQLGAPNSYFRAFSISLCALFLCAFLAIFVMRHFGWKWVYLAMLTWIAANFLSDKIIGEQWELILSQTHIVIIIFVAILACTLFLLEIKKFMNIRESEVAHYAGC